MDQLNRILGFILENEIASFFCAVIAAWMIFAVFLAMLRPLAELPSGSKFIAITPTSLATLGVLGTFTGILIGLLDFKVNETDSVDKLLEGLKISFSTSIAGIGAAISFRLLQTIVPSGEKVHGATPESIYRVLQEIRNDGQSSALRSSEQLSKLREAISSEGDGSLLTQVLKLRTATQDGQQELIREFKDFAAHMTENNQKAIIEALSSVISDFNRNLTEQFGENFKQLNKAVHALVEWQDKYREYIGGLEERIEHALAAVEASQQALEAVQQSSERIPETIRLLEPALEGINSQANLLNAHLDSLALLRDKAIEAFPVIEQNFDAVTTHFTNVVTNAIAISNQTLENWQNSHATLRQGHEVLLESTNKAQKEFTAEFEKVLQQIAYQLSQESERHGELIETSAKKAREMIEASWRQSIESMNEQFAKFDNQVRAAHQQTMEEFGRNLASLSEKFVNDYEPLTERLNEVLDIARGVRQ